jgi:hypothetical protein
VSVAGKFEVAGGAIDGVNVVFTVSAPYVPKSVAVFLNGQLKRKDYGDGWAETTPTSGVVTLAEAPIDGDVVMIFYIDASPGIPDDTVEVSPLVGKLVEVEALSGLVAPTLEVQGALSSENGLNGTLRNMDTIAASLIDVEQLHGVIAEVCE